MLLFMYSWMSFPKSMKNILSTTKALEKFLYFLKAICFVDIHSALTVWFYSWQLESCLGVFPCMTSHASLSPNQTSHCQSLALGLWRPKILFHTSVPSTPTATPKYTQEPHTWGTRNILQIGFGKELWRALSSLSWIPKNFPWVAGFSEKLRLPKQPAFTFSLDIYDLIKESLWTDL